MSQEVFGTPIVAMFNGDGQSRTHFPSSQIWVGLYPIS